MIQEPITGLPTRSKSSQGPISGFAVTWSRAVIVSPVATGCTRSTECSRIWARAAIYISHLILTRHLRQLNDTVLSVYGLCFTSSSVSKPSLFSNRTALSPRIALAVSNLYQEGQQQAQSCLFCFFFPMSLGAAGSEILPKDSLCPAHQGSRYQV